MQTFVSNHLQCQSAPNNTSSVTPKESRSWILSHGLSHFLALLGPSEEMYFKNMQARLGQGQSLAAGAMHGILPAGVNQPFVAPHTPQMRPGAGLGGMAAGMSPATPAGVPLTGANSDMMSQSMLPGACLPSAVNFTPRTFP